MRRSSLLVIAAGLGASVALASPAYAAHEANNKVDFAATAAAPAADGFAISNLTGDGWQNLIHVDGLAATTTYTWFGIGGGRTQPICSLTTDADGDGMCRSTVNSFLGRTEVRDAAGTVVLSAAGSTDDDNAVEDGEIERRGGERFA